ncbi:hypothetical protein EHRUM4_08480 [Ehrlichia ruminantium]|uniref:Uncharacterized protein n=1 Tax=Ehrlichia ruminantium TaxID=779 RepID=A0A161LXC9_EHRRU|nr:hypothetical protein [Ehrlichia ruminantium]GAT75624.1 hypothetical protein EHRUM4_08480 [Ehrlichia ruminantium]GAT77597.1 hypothetical protein EHRUM2_08240 [Ehrlichia ruminantium]GAT78757.1 hypothetical protein EHRUM3_09870 [Ehrlichia ruminantium]
MQSSLIIVLVFLLLIIVLVGMISLCIVTLMKSNEEYYESRINDHVISSILCKHFVKFVTLLKYDVDMLCLQFPIKNRYEIYRNFDYFVDQASALVDKFIDRHRPLNSETICNDHINMIENMKFSVEEFVSKYPSLDKMRICWYFSNMCDLMRKELENLFLENTVLNKIDVVSHNTECKSSSL